MKKQIKIIYVLSCCLLTLLLFSCEQEVTVSPPDEPPPKGQIIINSYPEGFKIYIDGKDRARRTPDSINFVEEGDYELILKKEYFSDSLFTIEVEKDTKVELSIDFSKNTNMLGNLFVDSNPTGAEIFFNDSNTNFKTPHNFLNLLPGEYNINLKLKDHKDINYTAEVYSKKETKKMSVLIDTTIYDYFDVTNSLITTNNLTCLEIDNNDIIWMGTRNGVLSYDGTTWLNLTPSNSMMPHTIVTDIFAAPNNQLWISTEAGLALEENNDIVMRYVSNPKQEPWQMTQFPTDYYSAAFVRNQLPYFFATDAGLGVAVNKVNYSVWGYYNIYEWNFINIKGVDNHLTDVSFIKESSEILLGTANSGLLVFPESEIINEDLEYEVYSRNNLQAPSNNVSSIVSLNNEAWIGFMPDNQTAIGGLLSYSNGEIRTYNLGSSDSRVQAVFIDSRGYKWVATDKSVYYFQNFSDRKIINKDNTGLDPFNVNGISEDKIGNIWFSTHGKGLVKVKNVEKLLNK